jgi:hypothetical protein
MVSLIDIFATFGVVIVFGMVVFIIICIDKIT